MRRATGSANSRAALAILRLPLTGGGMASSLRVFWPLRGVIPAKAGIPVCLPVQTETPAFAGVTLCLAMRLEWGACPCGPEKAPHPALRAAHGRHPRA